MKVKELIEKLQKQDLEDEIYIFVDQDVGHTSDEYSGYYARNIITIEHDINYLYHDGSLIRNILEIKNRLLYDLNEYDYDFIHKDVDEKLIHEEIKANYKKLKGCWITIQP